MKNMTEEEFLKQLELSESLSGAIRRLDIEAVKSILAQGVDVNFLARFLESPELVRDHPFFSHVIGKVQAYSGLIGVDPFCALCYTASKAAESSGTDSRLSEVLDLLIGAGLDLDLQARAIHNEDNIEKLLLCPFLNMDPLSLVTKPDGPFSSRRGLFMKHFFVYKIYELEGFIWSPVPLSRRLKRRMDALSQEEKENMARNFLETFVTTPGAIPTVCVVQEALFYIEEGLLTINDLVDSEGRHLIVWLFLSCYKLDDPSHPAFQLFKKLVELGANPDETLREASGDRITLLMEALQKGFLKTADFLLECGADPLAVSAHGTTTLMELIPGVVRVLSPETSEDYDFRDNFEWFIKTLIDAGVDPNAANRKGKTMFEMTFYEPEIIMRYMKNTFGVIAGGSIAEADSETRIRETVHVEETKPIAEPAKAPKPEPPLPKAQESNPLARGGTALPPKIEPPKRRPVRDFLRKILRVRAT